MKPLLGGTVYHHTLDGWDISWESWDSNEAKYRHWCIQQKPAFGDSILIVMCNPGSLSGSGENLSRDTTLRILRKVGEKVALNQTVVNLFDYATPKPQELHANWAKRDRQNAALVYSLLKNDQYCAVLFAYGDSGFGPAKTDDGVAKHRRDEWRARIAHVRTNFASLPEIVMPTTGSGNPIHTMNWERTKVKDRIVEAIESQVCSVETMWLEVSDSGEIHGIGPSRNPFKSDGFNRASQVKKMCAVVASS